jgi:hypothetical protein
MRSYTDIKQSKALSEILPIESADMHYNNASIKGINYADEYRAELMDYNTAQKVLSKYLINPMFGIIPCWSLASLLSVLPDGTDIVKDKADTENEKYMCTVGVKDDIISTFGKNPVDACYEMILKLKENNLL